MLFVRSMTLAVSPTNRKKSLKSKIHLKELVRESKMLNKEILVEPNKKTG